MSAKRPEVPPAIVTKLRAICLALPEAHEEAAWIGTRWRIRKDTFAHVLMIDKGGPAAYARAAKSNGPLCVLTFQSLGPTVDPETYERRPFFRAPWRPGIVGRVMTTKENWTEIGQLMAASYCLLAPKKLAEQVRAAKS